MALLYPELQLAFAYKTPSPPTSSQYTGPSTDLPADKNTSVMCTSEYKRLDQSPRFAALFA